MHVEKKLYCIFTFYFNIRTIWVWWHKD